jgi:hypothetical protein
VVSQNKTEDRQYKIRIFGRTRQIAAAMWDGPITRAEFAEYFHAYLRWFGLFDFRERLGYLHDWMGGQVEEKLDEMIERGWVVQQGETYALTPLGREQTGKAVAEMRRTFALAGRLLHPQTVSKVSLGVHFGLAVVKLPAALLSGSVGLLNDAADTLLDGVSSLLVYAGLHFDKERAINVILVLLMLSIGGVTLYEAIRRFFVYVEPDVMGFSYLATILSAVACTLLYFCQRFIGSRSGSVALITQSVDSRNHVIVAVSVTVGLIASALHVSLLDTLVGLAVALLIVKSAIELAVETVHSLGRKKPDLSHYKFSFVERYERFWQGELRDWMLYLVKNQQARTRAELIEQAHQVLDFAGNPMLRELGLPLDPQVEEVIGRCVEDLFERGWIADNGPLSVTSEGQTYLNQKRARERHEYGWQRPHRRFETS